MYQLTVKEKYLSRNIKSVFRNILFVKLAKAIKQELPFISGLMTTIFIATVYNKDIFEGRLRELAYLNKGIRIILMIFGKKMRMGILIQKHFIVKAVLLSLWKCWIKMPAAIRLFPKSFIVEGHDEAYQCCW